MNNDLLITVFVPVYNGEKYIEQTLNSIKKQNYANIEVLVVDDSSTDRSLEILNKYAQEDNRFKVFVKKNGGTVPHSMNYIIPKIKGDYFFYASQDDIFSLDLIEKMVQKQKETLADCILPDMEFYFENKQNNKRIIGLNGNKSIQLSGREACVASLNWSIPGFALINSNLIKLEFFPEDAFDSDEYMTRKLFLKSNKVVFSDGVFFYRQDNLQAITKTFGKKNFYVLNSAWKQYNLLKDNNFEAQIVFNSQLGIMQQYFTIFSFFKAYTFKNKYDKLEIKMFLINYKEEHLINSFFYYKLKNTIQTIQWKYLILVFVLKSPLLFQIYIKYRVCKLKHSGFLQKIHSTEVL